MIAGFYFMKAFRQCINNSFARYLKIKFGKSLVCTVVQMSMAVQKPGVDPEISGRARISSS